MNFGWAIENLVAGCRGPSTQADLKYLKAKGIRALVRLERRTGVTSTQIRQIGLVDYLEPVVDFGTPTEVQIDKILRFIDEEVRKKMPVAVSCGAGYGRTGTVLACFRIRHDS